MKQALAARAPRPALLAAGLLVAFPALALPPDARLELHGSAPHFEKVDPAFEAVLVEPPGSLHAELLPSAELLLEPKAGSKGAAIAHVFCFARRIVRVIEVTLPAAVRAPSLVPVPCAPVKDAASYAACRAQGGGTGVLSFELEGLQAEAKAAQDELIKADLAHLTIALSPYGVKIRGAKDEAEKRRALVAVWGAVLGPLRLDD